MAENRLAEAAQAAGFAMVNPDDFAREATPVLQPAKQVTDQPAKPATQKSWLNWDYMRLAGGKAPA